MMNNFLFIELECGFFIIVNFNKFYINFLLKLFLKGHVFELKKL